MAHEKPRSRVWTKEQDKAFENALAIYPEDPLDGWGKITAAVTGKSLEEVKHHYELLVEDVNMIESGNVPLPLDKPSPNDSTRSHGVAEGIRKKGKCKGKEWTETEHKLFLLGLEKWGKGAWKRISEDFVTSRSPVQVGSHAQKYFIRLNSEKKKGKQSSIHDITSVGPGDASVPQGQIADNSESSRVPAVAAVPGATQIAFQTMNNSDPFRAAVDVPAVLGSYGMTTGNPVDGPPAFDKNLYLTDGTFPELYALLDEDVDDAISALNEPLDPGVFPWLGPQM